MKITYYHTLYKQNVTALVAGDITFKDGYVYFHSFGSGYAIEAKYIVSITREEN